MKKSELHLRGKESYSRLLRWRKIRSDLCFEILMSGKSEGKAHYHTQRNPSEGSGSSLAEEMTGTWIKATEVRMKRSWVQEKLWSGMIGLVTITEDRAGNKSSVGEEQTVTAELECGLPESEQDKACIFLFFKDLICKKCPTHFSVRWFIYLSGLLVHTLLYCLHLFDRV